MNQGNKNRTELRPNDCMVYRRGDCGGIDCDPQTCSEFKCAVNVSEDVIARWPKYGAATAYRLGFKW